MKDKHITEVLDNAALAALSPSELDEIRAHARDCEPCGDAFAAAQLNRRIEHQQRRRQIGPGFVVTEVTAKGTQVSDRR